MYKKIKYFKWEKEGKRRYQIDVEKIFNSYNDADLNLEELRSKLNSLNKEDVKELSNFYKKSNNILNRIDSFMYWTLNLNLDQKEDIIYNNNILYNKKINYLKECKKHLGKKDALLNSNLILVDKDKEKYKSINKIFNPIILDLQNKIKCESDKNKKLDLIIELEYEFYKLNKKLNNENISLNYNPFYFPYDLMKQIIFEIEEKIYPFYIECINEKKKRESNFIAKSISTKKMFSVLMDSLSILGSDYIKRIDNALSENRIDYFNRQYKKQENHAFYNRVSIMGILREKDLFILSHEITHMIEEEFKGTNYYINKNNIDRETEIYAFISEYLSYEYFKNNKIDSNKFFTNEEIIFEFYARRIINLFNNIKTYNIILKMFKYFEQGKIDIKEQILNEDKEYIDMFLENVSTYNPYIHCIYIIAEYTSRLIADKIIKGEVSVEKYLDCLKDKSMKNLNLDNKYANLKKYFNIDVYDFNFSKMAIKKYFDEVEKIYNILKK